MPEFNQAEVRKEVQQLILNVLNRKKIAIKPEEIVEGLSLTTKLGIDSLDVLQVMATAEKKFSVKIPEDELKNMDDLGAIVGMVKKYWPKG